MTQVSTDMLPPPETPEGAAARIEHVDRLIAQGEAAIEALKTCRRQHLVAFLSTHGPVLPDGRKIEPARGGSLRIVDRQVRRG